MPSIVTAPDRTRALAALKQAESFIQGAGSEVGEDARKLVDALVQEGQRVQRAGLSLVLSLLSDEYSPVELFKPWASKSRFVQWRDDPAVKLDVIVRHGRLCIKPSAFLAHWRTLGDETKRKHSASAGNSSGKTPSSPGGQVGNNARTAKAARG